LASRSIPEGNSGGTARLLSIVAPFLAKRACARAAEPLLALSLSKGPLEPMLAAYILPLRSLYDQKCLLQLAKPIVAYRLTLKISRQYSFILAIWHIFGYIAVYSFPT